MPTEIHLITTQSGARQAKLQLQAEGSGQFWQLCRDYDLSDISFPEENIHVIEDRQGLALEDIKTPEQNEAAADFITTIVSQLTGNNNAAIHVSIAGGRKTMGYYLGYALSLYGRPQDRLSHVLVTDRYESLKDFFYPTPASKVIYDKDNHALDAKDAQVMMAEIPFVRLRGGIPDRLLDGKAGFSETVAIARQIETDPILHIDSQQHLFRVGNIEIRLPGVEFVFYLWMLQRSLDSKPVHRDQYTDNLEYADEFTQLYRKYFKTRERVERTLQALEKGMNTNWMSERISRANKGFKQALGENAAKSFEIKSVGKNNNKQYRIDLTEEQIQIED
ncbi:hypothetical protein AYM39_16065 [Methylomonas sp. DH-1]|nr:hypothetical protein AYM39_16065 [Methylomonas sp. DH-1]